jgi:pyrroline-5-carboxylate reductase
MVVGVLGTGNMGKAAIAGLLARYGSAISIVAHDSKEAALNGLPEVVSILPPQKWTKNGPLPEAVIIAVKPGDIAAALADFRSSGVRDSLWISIAAGVDIASIESCIDSGARICRAMPNMAAMIGEAVTAYALNQKCGSADGGMAEYILASMGKVVRVPEALMNAVTGLSGSGPAYVYLFIEALIEGGVTAGLPYEVARQSAIQTVIGAARMVERSGEAPAQLKARVMSPGGTTVAGLMALEKGRFKHSVIKAIVDATEKAMRLGKK